jgi:uncharacterized protein
LLSTRYWRALELRDNDESKQAGHALASYFTARGYAVVIVDARGSGASFGTRNTEWSDAEMHDLYSVIEWISQKPWCDGKVAAHGFSYGGNTAFMAAAAGHPALKLVVPQFADIDPYAHNLAPGGVVNGWLRDAWGAFTAALDRVDVDAVARCLPGVDRSAFGSLVAGPRPVDTDVDRSQLRAAVAEHQGNFNMAGSIPDDYCKDDAQSGPVFNAEQLGVGGRADAIQASGTPISYWAGWFDAGTAQGAIDLFHRFSNPMKVVIGPWNHGRRHHQDPLGAELPRTLPLAENFADVHAEIAACETMRDATWPRQLHYYTLGRNAWRSTPVWPPAGTHGEECWLLPGGRMSNQRPPKLETSLYRVDPGTSTGADNRWHTQIGCKPVRHSDRRSEDARLLVFDGPALTQPLELTGTPVAHLVLGCDTADAQLFVYLEAALPDGTVRMLTEGCLRLAHRKVPRHYRRGDLKPMPASGRVAVRVPLLPLSIELAAGISLRLAIAGADADTFIAPSNTATFTVQTGGDDASHVTLPVVSRTSYDTYA